jgi:phospholipase C
MYIHAATSEGYVHNAFERTYTSKTVYELFEEKGLSWAVYFHDLNEVIQFKKIRPQPDGTHKKNFRRFDARWASDVANGELPNYSFIFPRFIDGGARANSQHAPEDVRHGELLIAKVYDTLAQHPEVWNRSVLIVTYDEHGGFYDHVVPSSAPSPDGIDSPNSDDTADFPVPRFGFDRLGMRVPTLIASPWVPKGIVENRALQHTSVISTVREIFDLAGPLNERDASAASFADLFEQLDEPRPQSDMPQTLPTPTVGGDAESVVAEAAVTPSDEPLDTLTEEWVRGFARLTESLIPSAGAAEAVEAVPTTHGDAAEFVDRRLRDAFGI